MPKNIERPVSGDWKDKIDKKSIETIASALVSVNKSFDKKKFVKKLVTPSFLNLELKDRINKTAELLKEFLPNNYSKAVGVLIKSAPKLGEFENWILTAYIEHYGLEHFEDSINALEKLTPFGTSEFAIRPFMISYPDKMIKILNRWSINENEHVRRLAAEASRPRGVWVAHLKHYINDPTEVIDLLDKLNNDPSLYVRKAVANCINDISKDHPDLVIKTSKRWQKNNSKETNWIIKHGCRSLIKKGNAKVFPLLGFSENPKYKLSGFETDKKKIRMGEQLVVPFLISAIDKRDLSLAVDYKIHFVKQNGKTSEKVFKISEKKIQAGSAVALSLKHKFIDNTTRKHYIGEHRIELIINGISKKNLTIDLK